VRTSTTFDVDLPDWLHPLATASERVDPLDLSRFIPPDDPSVRQSAVLILLADGNDSGGNDPADNRAEGNGPDVLLTERAWTLRSHAGQMAFPGGRSDEKDGTGVEGLVRTALREAEEETGLDPSGVEVFAVWPSLWVPVSNYGVSPVLAWWRKPSPVAVVDPAEVASVHRVAVAALADSANRVSCRHPSGFTGPAFLIKELFIWGFTAGLLDKMLKLGGWARDWDPANVVPLPDRLVEAAWRNEGQRSEDVRRMTAIEHDLGRGEGVE
jgi:8-oxo-dGTP pyrophosphatase MutT (NUDIX family)